MPTPEPAQYPEAILPIPSNAMTIATIIMTIFYFLLFFINIGFCCDVVNEIERLFYPSRYSTRYCIVLFSFFVRYSIMSKTFIKKSYDVAPQVEFNQQLNFLSPKKYFL